MAAAAQYWFGPLFEFGSQLYARGERVAETVALLRIGRYLGEVPAEVVAACRRYIEGWRIP